ncbi:MAG: hypothetical protein K2X68_12150 [Novosphingobium sp.]|nr:hypothetical protein [Novosphingobium sp.]
MPVIIPLLATALLASAPAVAPPPAPEDFSWILNAPDNAVRACEIVSRADGDHLLISMAKHDAGDAIHIVKEDGLETHDYVFSRGRARKGRFNYESKTLPTRDQIDIPLRTAIGLTDKSRAERIFTKSGIYSVYIGYGFRTSDEAEIYGACKIAVTVQARQP